MSGVPDYTLEDTLDFKFTTRQFSTGAPFAFAAGAIEIYEDNDITQITAAETLTLEFDGVTGLHNLRVAATAANGFENGKSYHAVVSAGTVDGVSVVGEVVQQFSIGRSAAAVDLANGTDGLSAIKAETALILTDTAEIGAAGAGLTAINLPNQTMDIVGNITGNLSGSVGSVSGAVGSVSAAVTVGAINSNVISAATIAANAFEAGKFAAASLNGKGDWNIGKTGYSIAGSVTTLDGLNNVSTAQVNAEVLDVLNVDTFTEITGVPGFPSSIVGMVQRMYAVAVNGLTVTATKKKYLNAAGSAQFEKDLSDDATTYAETNGNAP